MVGRGSVRVRAAALAVAVVVPVFVAGNATVSGKAQAAPGQSRQISSSGSAGFVSGSPGSDAVQNPEYRAANSDGGMAPYTGSIGAGKGGDGQGGSGSDRNEVTNPKLKVTFDALNHRQNRLASNRNQFSLEPPDQGLCVGNGQVLETLNDVVRAYDKAGTPLTDPVALNAFYGYQPSIIRATPGHPAVFGQFTTDPSCLFDAQTQRFYVVILTLETNPATGGFTGDNHIDIAVSRTASATGAWNVYKFSARDDGTQGTPDHHCSLTQDANGNPKGHGPCFGDYPHVGADASGFYITTNEYSFFGPEFHAAQVYALSKRALARGDHQVTLTQFDTFGLDKGNSGFTLAPAQSSGGNGDVDRHANGTEFLMSSNAADEAHGNGIDVGPRTSTDLLVWALTNTGSLDSGAPDLALQHTTKTVGRYGVPPASDQRATGHAPLLECLQNTECATFLNGEPDPFAATETRAALDSSDSRMHQVTLAHEQLWGALDTALTIGGVNKAGIEYFIVSPHLEDDGLQVEIDRTGYLGLKNNNLTYPAIGVTAAGKAVMGFTVVGADHFPSAGYAGLSAEGGAGNVLIAAEGKGPQDGFSGYLYYGNPPGTKRPRWGDYGAAAVDGNTVWLASEYINQSCDLATYEGTATSPFGSCNGTRTALANWGTRITQVVPG